MTDYAVLYSDTTGEVLGAWVRTASDNISTMSADGYLAVDGVHVVDGLGSRSDLAGVVLTDPTDLDPEAPLQTHEVDSAASPMDADERVDSGRAPATDYDFDNPLA